MGVNLERVKNKNKMAASKTTLLAVFLILFPIIYQVYFKQKETKIFSKTNIESVNRKMDEKIAIGLNADVDYIISAIDLLTSLNIQPVQGTGQYTSLSTLDQLQDILSYSMSTCSGIERHFDDKTVFDKIVKAANELKHEEFVGGNAALMANTIAKTSPHSKILLAAPVGRKLRQYLNTSIHTITDSNTVNEEIHVILEYSKGEKWGHVTATCANRVIISHDVANSKLISLEEFDTSLSSYDPTLIILSGLHMLEGQPESVWKKRLNDVVTVLKKIPHIVPIHLEMATVGNLLFLPHIADTVFPYIDSLGLNEQELVSLAKCKQASFNFTDIGPKPSITHTSDLLHWLYRSYGIKGRDDSRLSRIHFHSLSFHILVVPKNEVGSVQWSNSLLAAHKASTVASLQACNSNSINSRDFELQIPKKIPLSYTDEILKKSVIEFTPDNEYIAWNREGTVDYNFVPVYVCKAPVKTVGLGDAISATGLLQSQFKFTQKRLRKRKSLYA